MNIVIAGTAYPLRGGIAHFNALLEKHLRKRHSVSTVTFSRQYPSVFFPGKTQEETGGSTADAAPAPQIIDSINPFNWFRAARTISKLKPDLLIFKYWMPFFAPCFGTIARLVKKRTGAKVLYICDNVIPHERRPGDIALTRYAFAAGDYFIVQSDAVEKDLRGLFPGAVYRKVPHPVYENFGAVLPKLQAREQLGITTRNVILYFGYIRPYKGLMVLFDAMKDLRTTSGDSGEILLLAVGECYDDESKYLQKIADGNLGSSVRLVTGYVPNDQVALYFSAADVVVLPYLSATQSGIAQIAYHFNKPVIVTNVGGLAEVVKDGFTGFVVPPGDAGALASAIRSFYLNRKEDEFTANVGREKLKYSWDNIVNSIEQLVASGERS
jgi:glycosyltransferase involved in cell wall biosynthesis